MANKIRRTLFIGLGGTGMKALLYTKKMLYDTYGEIPPMIGFLGLDTDGGVYNNTLPAKDGSEVSLSISEQLPLCVQQPALIYNNSPKNYDWLPSANAGSLTALSIGAGAVRSNGRFAITMHEDEVANRIQTKLQQINSASIINNARYGLLDNNTEVHMVFSIGGGTGCGTFLNMAYLVQRLIPGVKLSGYAVMSDVFRAMMQGAAMVRVRPNAYGAIKDLDYLMHLDPNSTPVELKWIRETEKIRTRPFTALYFIDNKNANSDAFSNVDQLCEMISLALLTATSELSVATASVSDNVAKVIGDGSMDILNKKAWAAGFGVSEILFDNQSLAKIYANKARIQIISHMLNGGCDDPSAIANAWIDDNHLRENLGKDDVTDYFMAPAPQYMFDSIDDYTNPKPECEQFIEHMALPKEKDLTQKLTDLQDRVAKELDKLIDTQLNRDCGVYLTEHILHSILKQVELCDEEMKEEMDDKQTRGALLKNAVDSKAKELEECTGIFNKGKRRELARELCESVMNLARNMREYKRRQLARQFYNWLRTQVRAKFDIVNDITRNLQAVRDLSSAEIETLRQNIGNGSFFQEDLAALWADKVICPPADIVFNDFIQTIRQQGGVRGLGTISSQQVGETLWEFVSGLPKMQKLHEATVEDILNTFTPEQRMAVCQRAIRKSLPLFPYHYHGYDAEKKTDPVDSYYVGVGDKDATCLNNEDRLFKNLIPGQSNVQFASTGVHDRIIIYRQIGVVPAFCLASMDGYYNEYDRFEREKEFTSHWDSNLCRRMAAERFSLMPQRLGNEDDILSTWVMGIIFGMITYDPAKGTYMIRSKALGGKPLSGFRVPLAASRAESYNIFRDNFSDLKDEFDAEMKKLDKPGPDNPVNTLPERARAAAEDGTYLSQISRCPIDADTISAYPDEEDLLNRELTFLLES